MKITTAFPKIYTPTDKNADIMADAYFDDIFHDENCLLWIQHCMLLWSLWEKSGAQNELKML